jgi:hypothetical protein
VVHLNKVAISIVIENENTIFFEAAALRRGDILHLSNLRSPLKYATPLADLDDNSGSDRS